MTTDGDMKTDNQKQVLDYFASKAQGYDLVDGQVYWRLSDELLWFEFSVQALSRLGGKFSFLDAGGGTGRWSKRVLDAYPESRGMIYDLSPDMLAVARNKQQDGLQGRLNLQQGDIQNMVSITNGQFDVTFNFHNVLGFVDSPIDALSEMGRVTRDGGYVVSFVPNLYHNVFFNVLLGRLDEAEIAASSSKGRFTSDMPYMHMFTPESITRLYNQAGIPDVSVLGFPITIYPGMQETQITGSTEGIKDLLGTDESFKRVYELEKRLASNPEAAARGNNLFVIGVR